MRKTTIASDKKPTAISDFISKHFGESIDFYSYETIEIKEEITINVYDVQLMDNNNERDEIALFHYTPYEDNQPYLTLEFIPEYNNISGETRRTIQVVFKPAFFERFKPEMLFDNQPFKLDRSAEQIFTHNTLSREALDFITSFKKDDNDILQHIKFEESILQLLRHSIKAFYQPDEANLLPACSFLNFNSEREKVVEAQKVIMQQLENPLTIRELSRIVGMNECYLKKGFKAMYGKSIHEYWQYERIEKAKILLKQKELTVNEVAFQLGFGSASHFSTSFKKITGMKPCELLQ